MLSAAWAILAAAALLAPPEESVDEALRRLSEEAAAFARVAPEVISQETWRQKAAKRIRRGPHIHMAPQAPGPPQLSYRLREITSEYGFATLKDKGDSGGLHEFRRLVSVDGRRLDTASEARRKLSLALAAPGDRDRLRLLRDFERLGLTGAVTDFGQIILLFTRRQLADYNFAWGASGNIGPDAARCLSFRQVGGSQAFRLFEGSHSTHMPLEGRVWVRQGDWLPLRIEIRVARRQGEHVIEDLATVDYVQTPHGALLPASVHHRQQEGERLDVENTFQYGAFQRFSASAEIKFTEVDEPPPPPRPK